jgi:PAS domain S-box-containing protein
MTGRLNSLWLRLLLGYFIPLALFGAAALVAYVTIQRLLDALHREDMAQKVFTEAYRLKVGLVGMAAYKSAHHLVTEFKQQEYYTLHFKQTREKVLRDLKELRRLVQDDPERKHQLGDELTALAKLEEEWYQKAQEDFKLFDRNANPKQGTKGQVQLQLREGFDLQREMGKKADQILEVERNNLLARRRQAEETTREGVWTIAGGAVLALLLSFLVSLQVARGVTHPINELREAAGRLRQGELAVVTPTGPAEIAELARSFNLMGVALTERQALLQTSEHRYRTLVGSTATILWTTDAQGRNTELSRWCAFTGQTAEEARGDGWLQAVHPDDRAAFAHQWTAAVADRAYAENEIRLRRADGVYRTFQCRSVPVLDARGQVVEWVRCCADITEHREEEALRKDKEAAEAASRAKSDFLAKMSHELRTPLNAVIGMSKMLTTQRFGPLNAKQLDYLSDITGAGEHLLTLINDILDLSKVEAGRMELVPEPLDVGATLSAAVSTVRTLAEAKGLTLTGTPPEPDGVLVADPARLKQILFNLLSNAVKFTPAGGRVSVCCRWADGTGREARAVPAAEALAVRFDVEDTGVGIDPKDHGRIGNEFYQARRGRSQAADGTGLGLALTRRLVNLMGGGFWFRSAPGAGSSFSFALPLRPARPRPRDGTGLSSAETPALPAGGRPAALVIEDHVPTNKLLTDWLLEAGLEVASAFSGPEGLEAARKLRPQLILLDIRLPGMDGWQVLTELKGHAETAAIPVMIVSALEGSGLPRQLDVLEWFVKPLDKDRFLRRLRRSCPALFGAGRPVTVLVVDDEGRARKMLSDMLEGEGVTVVEAEGGREALGLLEHAHPDLVLLDLLMPQTDGFHFVQAVRGDPRWRHLPILVVTAKDLTDVERQWLNGHIQAVLSKDALTQEKLLERLRALGFAGQAKGVTVKAAASGGA